MDAFVGWYVLATLGLPIFGLVLLLVAALIGGVARFQNKTGRVAEENYSRTLAAIGGALVVFPTIYFLVLLYQSNSL